MIDRIRTDKSELRAIAENLMASDIAYIHCSELETADRKQVVTNTPESVYASNTANRSTPTGPSLTLGMDGPLLTPEGEEYLFRNMNFLKHESSLLKNRLTPQRPQKTLIHQIQQDLAEAEDARSAIVEANTRLVASIAHKFSNSRTEYEELISEGNMILVNAVDKFDYSRGFRFSTYATHAIQRHFYRFMQRKQRRRGKEIATSTEILADVAPDRENEQPLDHRIANALIERFGECLDEREVTIIRERFGLNESEASETLKVVAQKVGLSKERVRQLQMRAIEKLQDLATKMNLRLEPSF